MVDLDDDIDEDTMPQVEQVLIDCDDEVDEGDITKRDEQDEIELLLCVIRQIEVCE